MLQTGIPSFANRNVILLRLVASFPLSFTISADVLCLKFGGVWEMLWIFKVARWTHDWCIKINKSPTVSGSVGSSSFDILSANLARFHTLGTLTNSQRFKLEILLSQLPCRHPNKTWHSGEDISDFGKELCFYFGVTKSKPVEDTRTMYSQTGKNTKWAETFIWC